MATIKNDIPGLTVKVRDRKRPYLAVFTSSLTKRQISHSFFSVAEALEWGAAQRHAMENRYGDVRSFDLRAILDHYLGCNQDMGDSHRNNLIRTVSQLAAAGITDLSDPRAEECLQSYVKHLHCRRHNQRRATPASAESRRRVLQTVTMLHRHAANMGLHCRNPAALIRVKGQTKPRAIFSLNELERLVSERARTNTSETIKRVHAALRDCDGDKREAAKRLRVHWQTVNRSSKLTPREDPMWLFTVLGIYTGARTGELVAMDWSHINWQANHIYIPNRKNGKDLYVRMMPELRAILKDRRQEEGRILASAPGLGSTTNAFKAYLRRVGVKVESEHGPRTPHSLRAMCGALMVAMGVPDFSICLHLGHDTPAMTRHYSQLANLIRWEVEARDWVGGADFHLRVHCAPKPELDDSQDVVVIDVA